MQIKNSPSPLKLQRFFFQEIHFEAFPRVEETQNKAPECDIEYFNSTLDESNEFQVTLKVATKGPKKGERVAYRFSLTSVGLFKWNASFPQGMARDDFIDRLLITALSILYSGTRDMVRTITNAGPYHPGHILQPLSFVPETPKEEITKTIKK